LITGILLAAVKFIPMFHYLTQNRWEGMAQDATPMKFILPAFFSFNQALFRTVKTADQWGWHEYSSYLSPLIVVMAVIALIYNFRRGRIWLILALFFFLLGLGNFSSFSPWNLMMQLPGFSSLRSPARAFQFVILSLAVLGGFGLDNLLGRLKVNNTVKKTVGIMAVVVILAGMIPTNLPALKTIAHKQVGNYQFQEEFRHIIGDKFHIYDAFLKNRGSLMAPWLSAYKDSRAIVTEDNRVLMDYVLKGDIEVIERNYTPNLVEYKVRPQSHGKIVFGIGYDEGWRSKDYRLLFESGGLVSTDFSPNTRDIVMYYRPPYFYTGLIISILTLIFVFLIGFNKNFGKRCQSIFK
jgi:uncharacterized membrane protein YfhO